MKKFLINIIILCSVCLFCLGTFGGLVALVDLPKVKDDVIALDYKVNKPKN